MTTEIALIKLLADPFTVADLLLALGAFVVLALALGGVCFCLCAGDR